MTQKNMYIVAAIVVVLLVAGGIYWYMNQGNYSSTNSYTTTPTDTTTTATDTNGATLTYTAAQNLYKNKIIQFSLGQGNYCNVTPDTVVFKKGTAVMLDNRINEPLKVSLDGVVHNIKAYGFEIITLTTSAKLPHTISIDCGSGQNNASITLE